MKLLMTAVMILMLISPVHAMELNPPPAPEDAVEFMPSDPSNLREGLLEVLKEAVSRFRPDLKEASAVCLGIMASVMTVSVLRVFPGKAEKSAELAGAVLIAGRLLSSAGSLIHLGTDTVSQISEYGKLLLPVLTAGLAAQGAVTTSAALYTATLAFNTLLSNLISRVLTPMIYLYLMLAVANSAVGEETLKKLRDTVRWLMTWVLKIFLYIYTGYISITGVVSGPTDAAALKAAKLTISGMVPVVGGILSDASEAVLVGAGAVKNATGLYGLFAVLAIWLDPFLKIGAHYLMLRFTGGICGIFGGKRMVGLIEDFAGAMGLILGMTGAVCLMLLISVICFMRGVG